MQVKENPLKESIPFLKTGRLLNVISVLYLGDYRLQLKFNNGIEGIVDLEKELYGEIFEPLKDKAIFQEVYLTSRTIEWANGADFAPEFLIELVQEA